jgi:glycosyltransferase involved in cell wall biosynthesis
MKFLDRGSMKPEICVILCTHNPRPHYLKMVLGALERQTLARDRWRLLLVDNASEDFLSESVDIKWHPLGQHIREEQLGLTAARLAGIRAAESNLLVFVDDDNELDVDYLEMAIDLSGKWSAIGAWGGQIRPKFEAQPPDWTKKYWPYLAIREFERDHWSNSLSPNEATPCGAGMCVRKQVADAYAAVVETDGRRMGLDRKGASLVSCGDTDLALVSCDLGLGTGVFRGLKLTHLIPSERLLETYLLRLVTGIVYSECLLRSWRGENPPKPSRSEQIYQLYVRSRLSKLDRRFYDAVRAGRDAASKELEHLRQAQKADALTCPAAPAKRWITIVFCSNWSLTTSPP